MWGQGPSPVGSAEGGIGSPVNLPRPLPKKNAPAIRRSRGRSGAGLSYMPFEAEVPLEGAGGGAGCVAAGAAGGGGYVGRAGVLRSTSSESRNEPLSRVRFQLMP